MTDTAIETTYDAEFFLDPVCPWCWITSRWVHNVQAERGYRVGWRFIALKILNENATDEYALKRRDAHAAGFRLLRMFHAVREREGNDALGEIYSVIGTELHTRRRFKEFAADPEAFVTEVLSVSGRDASYARDLDDDSRDDPLREETAEALSRTGSNVGTPIITFAPGTDRERSFFGPVIPRAPEGDEAVALWDAVETIARADVAELKRTRRGEITFN